MNVLFVCSRNRLRSPTAELVFSGHPGIETDSAGLAPDADVQLDRDQVRWADLIVVMEKRHRSALNRRFGRLLAGTRVVCLDIPDNYEFMQPELIAILERRMAQYLR
ncbi:MAG: low molecular weight protein tyrosine phosphatase family protein [Salinibacterium sp.]|nr:low molecular weight protein tyrosine phosphatase family protein [Salinibacterium sp.]